MPRLLLILLLIFPGAAFAGLDIDDAWIKNLPPAVPVRAGYMTIRNAQANAISIVAIRSDAFASVEIHQTIAGVTEDLDSFHFNRAVARIYELVNRLGSLSQDTEAEAWVRREGFDVAVRLIGPMMPHLGEELWQRLGNETLLTDTPWPQAAPDLLVEDTVTIAVQVKGNAATERSLK